MDGNEKGSISNPAIYINPIFRKQGLAINTYKYAGQFLANKGIILKPDAFGNNESSRKIWHTLLAQNIVTKNSEDRLLGDSWILDYSYKQQSDRIILFAAPTSGKTTALNNGADIIDFDTWIGEATKELYKKNKINDESFQDYKARFPQELKQHYIDSWDRAKLTGKDIYVSQAFILNTFSKDFDKVYLVDKEEFRQRLKDRGSYNEAHFEDWYNNIILSASNFNGVITLGKNEYISDIITKREQQSTSISGEQKVSSVIAETLDADELDFLNDDIDVGESYNPQIATDVSADLVKLMNEHKVTGITLGQQYQLVDYLYNQASFELNQKGNLDGKQVLESLKEKLNFFIDGSVILLKSKIAKGKSAKVKLSSVNTEEAVAMTNKVNALLAQHERHLAAIEGLRTEVEQNKVFQQTFDKLVRLSGAKVHNKKAGKESIDNTNVILEDSRVDDITIEEQSEKIYDKQGYEENPADSISFKLKRFMSGINQVGSDGKVKYGFLDVPLYVDFKEVYAVVKQLTSNEPSDYKRMIDVLRDSYEQYPFLQQFVERLEKEPSDIKKQFVTSMSQGTVNMVFVAYKKTDKGVEISTFNANSSNKQRVIFENWNSASFTTDLVTNIDGKWIVNQEEAEKMRQLYREWIPRLVAKNYDITKPEMVVEEAKYLQEFLKNFGIDLHERVAKLIVSGNLVINNKKVPYRNQLESKNVTGRLIYELVNALGVTEIADGDSILKRVAALNTLIRQESYYNNFVEANSFRIGDKQIYNYTNNHYAFDRTRELASSPELRQQYRETSFAKNSMYLQLLELKQFQDLFSVEILSPEALKDLANETFGDRGIQSLSDIDHEIAKLAAFTTTKGESEIVMNGITYRTLHMFAPTMSDKSQMTLLHTAVRKMQRADLEGNVLPQSTIDYIIEQTVSR